LRQIYDRMPSSLRLPPPLPDESAESLLAWGRLVRTDIRLEPEVDCPFCGHTNPAGARFCGGCATALSGWSPCVDCGALNPAGQAFCNACGRTLSAPGESTRVGGAPTTTLDPRAYTPEHLAAKIRAARGVLEGERKQVTVLFVDVVRSMDLAEQSDPERLGAIMERFYAVLAAGVHRFEGTIDKFTGDGMLALFGAPIACEDHGRRACYAALALQRDLAAFAEELHRTHRLRFAVRMGLNSGEVVVGTIGEDLGMDYGPVGHAVGLAHRMQQVAAPNTIYVSEQTASLVQGYLALTDLGEFNIKGVSRALRIYELTGVGAVRVPLDLARARGLSRIVGRDEELQVLESAWRQARAGQGQLIGIVGAAGIGKSRLCHEFAERQRARGVPVYHVAGQAHAQSVPLMPLLQLLRAYFEISEADSDRTARERIARKLQLLEKASERDLPLIFDFLGVSDPEHPVERMDPEARQRRLLAVMKRLTRAQGVREPGVTLIEDLHWLDAASEVFLANHVDALHGTPGLTVVNFRPEYHVAWMSRSYYRQIALAPLPPHAVEELLADLLGCDPSLAELLELVRGRTQGNPFFIEELVRALVEAGNVVGERGAYRLAGPVTGAAVPASVQVVLAARIDRLPRRNKAVLQAAAVIGSEFSGPVLQRVAGLAPAELEHAVGDLIAGEFIYEQEVYPEAIYAFTHPLTREVAYGSQLGDRRASAHAAVARAIAEQQPERLDERAALVAHHWEAAGQALEAARWHARAAAWSGFNDPSEALRHWRDVRTLAQAVPESGETVALGLVASINSLNLGWRLGISIDDAQAEFSEAVATATKAGDIRSRALLLAAYGAIRGTGDGNVSEMATLARQAIALAEESRDPTLYIPIAISAYAFFCTGESREGVAVLDRAIELARGDPRVAAGTSVGCPFALCHAFKGLGLIGLGELDQARRLIERGREIAREQGDTETLGWTHAFSALLAQALGEPETALGHAQQALEIAERIGDSFSRAQAWFYLGFAERMRGQWRPAIEALERSQAIATERRTTLELQGVRLALLGESYLGLGDLDRARVLVHEGLGIARTRRHRSWEIYASVALARVLLRSAGPAAREQVEAALTSALELARDTGAKAFEPLVYVELAELARQGGDRERRERELREAGRLFSRIGATGLAERLAGVRVTPAE
jgi:class 3 adenylate cyclase/tetratricopeptide (TPR) repeat protein